MIGRAVCCSSGRPTPPRPGRSGRPSPSSSGRRRGKAGAGAGREDGQKKKPGQAARCMRCCSGFASLPAWWCRAVVLPGGGGGADRGQAAGTSPAAQFPPAQFQPEPFQGGTVSPPLIRQNAAGRRGQILHLTAYRPIGNGELGSMPPYYPP